jgi:methionyl-tRNA synthetase
LTEIAWGGLKAGTKFGEPAPLFPRAEKDAVERMQKIEEQNSLSVVEAASGSAAGVGSAEEGDGGVNPRVRPIESKGASAPENGTLGTPPAPLTLPSSVKGTGFSPYINSAKSAGALAPEGKSLEDTPVIPASPAVEPAAVPATEQLPSALAELAPPQVAPQIAIDDFVKVDLRVAQILVAERVPKADKLLRLEVDLGYEKRQILAGIAQFYEPEKLIGRKIVIVANLAPRKMRGLESNGMLLAASLPDGAPVLAGFLEEVPLGARLK